MKLVKCPRCDLNYIMEGEKLCKVCQREMRGEQPREEIELCSICNEAPALPGKDVCLLCLREMSGGGDSSSEDHVAVDEATIGIDPVSTMDEIIPEMEMEEEIPAKEFGEIDGELSLESVIEEENADDDEDKEDDQ